jgi:hypothetical protein
MTRLIVFTRVIKEKELAMHSAANNKKQATKNIKNE